MTIRQRGGNLGNQISGLELSVETLYDLSGTFHDGSVLCRKGGEIS